MPKMRTSSAAKKRFRLTAGGKLMRRRAFRTHLLEHKSAKRRRFKRRCASWESDRRAEMARVKRSVHGKKKRREVLEAAKGYRGLKNNTYRKAKEQMLKSLSYAYRDRRVRKRDFRRLWIIRINAGARSHGLSYNQFMFGLKKAEIELDRKVLADLAVSDPKAFGTLAEAAKAALAA